MTETNDVRCCDCIRWLHAPDFEQRWPGGLLGACFGELGPTLNAGFSCGYGIVAMQSVTEENR